MVTGKLFLPLFLLLRRPDRRACVAVGGGVLKANCLFYDSRMYPFSGGEEVEERGKQCDYRSLSKSGYAIDVGSKYVHFSE